MKTSKTYLIVGAVVCLIVGMGIGYKFAPKNEIVGAISNPGVSNSNQQYASVTMAPATSAASTTSILNTSSDRNITDSFVECQGVGTSGTSVANLSVQAATTSVSGLGLQGNTNYAFNSNVSTSTATVYVASSTEGVIQYVSRIWPSGTYLTYIFNTTNSASCTVGSHYFAL